MLWLTRIKAKIRPENEESPKYTRGRTQAIVFKKITAKAKIFLYVSLSPIKAKHQNQN